MLPFPVPSLSFSRATVLYDPKTFITHAASLRQAFAHCARFPTAASRRSLDRVSVPVWLVVLSDQLPVVGLVSHYLTNYLIGRGLIDRRPLRAFSHSSSEPWSYPVLARLSAGYLRPKGRLPTCYAPVRHFTTLAGFSFDLHVLGTPPALVLSQDQTLQFDFLESHRRDVPPDIWLFICSIPARGRITPASSRFCFFVSCDQRGRGIRKNWRLLFGFQRSGTATKAGIYSDAVPGQEKS